MSYTIDHQTTNDALVIILGQEFVLKTDFGSLLDDILAVLDKLETPIYYISNVEHLELSFVDVVQSLAQLTRGQKLLHHDMIREILVISDRSMVKFATSALEQAQYGKLRVQTFKTLEECLDYIQSERVKI